MSSIKKKTVVRKSRGSRQAEVQVGNRSEILQVGDKKWAEFKHELTSVDSVEVMNLKKTRSRGQSRAPNSSDMIMGVVFDMVMKAAIDKFSDESLDPKSVTEFAVKIMELVEDFPINGVEKKSVVLRVLAKFADREFNEIDVSDKVEYSRVEQIRFVIMEVLPFAIDTIISVSRHELAINAAKKTKSMFQKIGCCNDDEEAKPTIEDILAKYDKMVSKANHM